MSKYAGTKTEKNLMEAFAGESQARNKYTYYADVYKRQPLITFSAGTSLSVSSMPSFTKL